MIDEKKRLSRLQEKEKVRKRMHATVDPQNYSYIPAKKPVDYYDTETPQRVAIYVRVSTDDVRQTTSYELQKKYYEDFVLRHDNWTLVNIYADEGISGTSLKHRDAFNQMIADCKAGKIDLIITKSVSRFARNVMITIGMARDLAHLRPPVGIFFESECIFSLNDDSQMALTFQATMAEEESHTRSRSMETSLRMRLDNGIPLTPKLLGYTHDEDGNLIVNPDEAPTVKLVFYMYLYGYSTSQIAETLNALNRKSYLGNCQWTSSAIVQILRNERHCGDVLTRKTFTEDFRTHRSIKNRGDRPQSWYFNHHEGIVSRDDFIAVQRMLDNAKYGNHRFLPELQVIRSGMLRGFVSINPRWAGFKAADYYQASSSVLDKQHDQNGDAGESIEIAVNAGDLDLRGFEVTRSEFLNSINKPAVSFQDRTITFNRECAKKFGDKNYVEILINPITRCLAVRTTSLSNRNGARISQSVNTVFKPKPIHSTAFQNTLYEIMGWNPQYRYRIIGTLWENSSEFAFVFNGSDTEVYLASDSLRGVSLREAFKPLDKSGSRTRAIPQEWLTNFGRPYYIHERSFSELASQSQSEWQLHIEGQLFETGQKLCITPFPDLQNYIQQELNTISMEEVHGSIQ